MSRGLSTPSQLFLAQWPESRRPKRQRRRLHKTPLPIQLILAFDDRTTPLMRAVIKVLNRLAATQQPMPNNPVLAELASARVRSSAMRALTRLEEIGHIRIEKENRRRRVVLLTTGGATGWGEARPGHKPYCRPEPKVEPQRLIYRPVTVFYELDLRTSGNCCWPTSPDGVKPVLFCDAPAERKKSYCAIHLSLSRGEEPSPCNQQDIALVA